MIKVIKIKRIRICNKSAVQWSEVPIHLQVESLVQGMMMEITKLTMINDKSDKNKKDRKDKNMQQICSAVV